MRESTNTNMEDQDEFIIMRKSEGEEAGSEANDKMALTEDIHIYRHIVVCT